MNKRYNYILNITESILTLITLSIIVCFGSLKLSSVSYNNYLFIITCLLLDLTIVLIESFLFLLYKKKYKVIYSIYMILLVLITVLVNSKLLLFGIYILSLGSMFKSYYRIKHVKEIYVRGSFKKYCKIFNIGVNNNTSKVTNTRVKPAYGKIINKEKVRKKRYA